VILVCGGTSEERRVSVASAQHVAAVCSLATVWFIAPTGAVHVCSADLVRAHERPFETDFDPGSEATFAGICSALDAARADEVFFLALHGGDGENGVIQHHLEDRGLAFTGSGSAASELAFDKARSKGVMAAAGARTPRSSVLRGDSQAVARELSVLFRERGRLVIKPVASGSSIGLHHVSSVETIAAIADDMATTSVPFLAEDFVRGTELTVGVVEQKDRPPVALPVSEIRLSGENASFDYQGKYLGRGSVEITPAQIAPALAQEAQTIALLAHQRIGCEGYSRTDLIASADGVYFLEINTLPGLTRASFIPQQLTAMGRSMDEFVADQVELAKARGPGKGRTGQRG
jgi:D-alanine-D-alanine ligase